MASATHLPLHFLSDHSVKPTTLQTYNRAVRLFREWMLECCKIDLSTHKLSVDALDTWLTRYFNYIYSNHQPKSLAINCLYGLNLSKPGISKRLPLSQRSLTGLNRLIIAKQRIPIPWAATVAIAMWMAAHNKFRSAVLTLLAFDCYLRIGEAVALRREDVGDNLLFGGLKPDPNRMLLHLRTTKTGVNKSVEVLNPHVIYLMRLVCKDLVIGDKVFRISETAYRRHFHLACKAFGIEDTFVPHCLRHGGATHDLLKQRPIEYIRQRGRWASVASVDRYTNASMNLMNDFKIPTRVLTVANSSDDLAYCLPRLAAAMSCSVEGRPPKLWLIKKPPLVSSLHTFNTLTAVDGTHSNDTPPDPHIDFIIPKDARSSLQLLPPKSSNYGTYHTPKRASAQMVASAIHPSMSESMSESKRRITPAKPLQLTPRHPSHVRSLLPPLSLPIRSPIPLIASPPKSLSAKVVAKRPSVRTPPAPEPPLLLNHTALRSGRSIASYHMKIRPSYE